MGLGIVHSCDGLSHPESLPFHSLPPSRHSPRLYSVAIAGRGRLSTAIVSVESLQKSRGITLSRKNWSELCSTIASMHSVGLVHRDIKLESAPPFYFFPFSTPYHPTHTRYLPTALIQLSNLGLGRLIGIPQPTSASAAALSPTPYQNLSPPDTPMTPTTSARRGYSCLCVLSTLWLMFMRPFSHSCQ